MLQVWDRIRSHVYPRGRFGKSGHSEDLRASSAILGMLAVMLAVLLVAYLITLIAGR